MHTKIKCTRCPSTAQRQALRLSGGGLLLQAPEGWFTLSLRLVRHLVGAGLSRARPCTRAGGNTIASTPGSCAGRPRSIRGSVRTTRLNGFRRGRLIGADR